MNIPTFIASTLMSFASVDNIRIDPGGSVTDRMQQIARIEQTETTFRIDGMCVSACTMYLGMKKICIAPRTILGFHSSYTRESNIPVPSKFGNATVMQYYPEKVRKWVTEKKALDSLDLTPMTAEEAWELGIPKCEER